MKILKVSSNTDDHVYKLKFEVNGKKYLLHEKGDEPYSGYAIELYKLVNDGYGNLIPEYIDCAQGFLTNIVLRISNNNLACEYKDLDMELFMFELVLLGFGKVLFNSTDEDYKIALISRQLIEEKTTIDKLNAALTEHKHKYNALEETLLKLTHANGSLTNISNS